MPIIDPSEYAALLNKDPASIMAKYVDVANWGFGNPSWQKTWQTDNGQTVGEFGRQVFGGQLTSVGVPLGAAFNAASAFAGSEPLPGQVAATLAKSVWATIPPDQKAEIAQQITDAMLQLFGGVIEGAKTIPVWGQVVGAVWDAGVGIYTLVGLVKAQNRPLKTIVERKAYSPGEDATFASTIRNALIATPATPRGEDLTWIFRPPSLGEGQFTPGQRFSIEKLEGGGWVLQGMNPAYGADGMGGYGFMPEYNLMHVAIEVPSYGPPLDTGRNYPTTRGIGAVIRSITSEYAHPMMYRVNWEQVAGMWEQYLLDMRLFLDETKKISKAEKQSIISWLASNPNGPMFGWSTSTEGPKAGLYEQNWGINDPQGQWDGTPNVAAPVKFAQMMRKRQEDGLKTTNVAYLKGSGVDTDPALTGAGNSDLLAMWQDNREKLLSDAALCSVDLKNVPDSSWRLAAENRLADPQFCAPSNIATAPADVVTPMPPPMYPGSLTTGTDDTDTEESFMSKYGVFLLGAAVLGGAGWAGYKFSQRRPNGLYLPR